ncbi:MAG: hypothetical protein U0Q16_07600 [Bryobacteraceae bacterium]
MDEILRAHAAELHSAYASLDRLDGSDREHAAALLDLLLAENLPLPDIGALGHAAGCLRRAVETAQPDRACIGYITSHFLDWTQRVTPEALPVWLEEFPALAPAAKDLGDAGFAQAIAAMNRDPRALSCLAAYAMSNREIITAMAALADHATQAGRVGLLQALVDAVPLEKMESSKDAEKLVPAIARVPQALEVAVSLARRDVSSALGACKALEKVVAKHPHADAFLHGFARLVDAIGSQCAGAATTTLANAYAKHGPEAAGRIVDAAVECARLYGARAAQALLEQRTKASRQLLP